MVVNFGSAFLITAEVNSQSHRSQGSKFVLKFLVGLMEVFVVLEADYTRD